jgi:hypothetical protein
MRVLLFGYDSPSHQRGAEDYLQNAINPRSQLNNTMNTTPIITKEYYESRERLAFHKQVASLRKAPLAERKEAMQDYIEALQIPGRMIERTEWLLNGGYGMGAYLNARDVKASKLMNRAAWFSQTIAALDHNCPPEMARKAFLSLPKSEQDRLNAEIEKAITDFTL